MSRFCYTSRLASLCSLHSSWGLHTATPIGCDKGRAPRRISANCWRNSCRLRGGRLDRHRRPKGTPTAIVEKLNREINSGLTNPNIKARLTELTTVPLVLTPEQFGSQMAAEIERWGKVVSSLALIPNPIDQNPWAHWR